MLKPSTLIEKGVPWLALFVSIVSATFTYLQTRTTRAQLKLNELQIRPYVKWYPVLSESKREINIHMVIESLSPIPAYVVYTELTGWIDGAEQKGVHRTGPEILYANKGGYSELPTITGSLAKRVLSSRSVLQLSLCVVYGSSSTSDPRRWEFVSVYEYLPGSEFPQAHLVEEIEVPDSKTKCDSKKPRERWIEKCAEKAPCKQVSKADQKMSGSP